MANSPEIVLELLGRSNVTVRQPPEVELAAWLETPFKRRMLIDAAGLPPFMGMSKRRPACAERVAQRGEDAMSADQQFRQLQVRFDPPAHTGHRGDR